MKKTIVILAFAVKLGTAMTAATILTGCAANPETINAPLGAGVINGGGYEHWADQALAPKGA